MKKLYKEDDSILWNLTQTLKALTLRADMQCTFQFCLKMTNGIAQAKS